MNTPILLTLNLLEDSILLNEGVLDALDWPRQVQIMINKDEKMLLLRACTIDDQQAVVVPEEHTVQFEISGRSLLRKIRHLVGWEDDARGSAMANTCLRIRQFVLAWLTLNLSI